MQSPLRWPLLAFMALFLVFLYAPLGVLSFQSGPEGGPQFPIVAWSTYWYRRLFGQIPPTRVAPLPIGPSLLRSLALAFVTMVTSTVLGVLAAQAFRRRLRFSGAVFYLIVLSMIVPGVLVGLGMTLLANALGIGRAWWGTTFVAHVLYTFPFAFLVMLAIFNRFDRPVEEAAWSLGVTRGRSGTNTDPLIAIGQAIMAMNTLGLSALKNPGNPSEAEIDGATKFLISKKKEGQFRALWNAFGELGNLLASGEMVVCDAWQPAVKAQGHACKYAVPKEGYRAWAIGVTSITGTPNAEAVVAYADHWLSGPPGITVSEQGYYSPTTKIKDVVPAAKHAFWYEGKPWSGAPERGIKEGDPRDGGSLAKRAAHIACWHQWPDAYDHLTQRWDEFLKA